MNGSTEDLTVIADLRSDDEGKLSLSMLSLYQLIARKRADIATGAIGGLGGV
jgi:hypothetical protein